MFKNDQYKTLFIGTIILVILTFTSYVSAKNKTFNPEITEFILKNTSSLAYQIKEKKGLGYISLKNQIILLDCKPKNIFSKNLLNEKNPYLFSKKFSKEIEKCKSKSKSKSKSKDIESLLKNKEAYLIISEESLKSPMSYFGHSLILFLDEKDFYFSPVVSISAPTDNLTAFEQITKGGFSHIEANINITPLHQIIDYYGHKESRKLKFIHLSDHIFNREKLIQYFKMESSKNLSYNFFYQNCSTYLYEALNYSCNCFKEKPMIITPSLLETRIQALEQENREFEINSLYYEFNIKFEKLNKNEKNTTKKIFSNNKKHLQKNYNAGVVAALASRLSFESYKTPNIGYKKILDEYGKDSSLLRRIPYFEKNKKTTSDNLNYSSIKIYKEKDSLNLKLSAIDFNHLEQRPKHFMFSKLSAGTIELIKKREGVHIESLSFLNIRTLIPIDFVTKEPSWRLRIGAERDNENKLRALTSFGVGASFSLSDFIFYTLPSVELKSSLNFPVYSGIYFKSKSLLIKYETKDLKENSLTFYKRENNNFGYEFRISKSKNSKPKTRIGLSYYF
ncbi:DUF4105 domain-containing protein [Marinomonas sp. TI.3.20]|uniref:lipoprotein N-acyltransferase Lnb domain-containing protein n=1 Tax=Marinomonas sp. TI.3.20 TaxID=3121296 RepID=UPI00311D7FD0